MTQQQLARILGKLNMLVSQGHDRAEMLQKGPEEIVLLHARLVAPERERAHQKAKERLRKARVRRRAKINFLCRSGQKREKLEKLSDASLNRLHQRAQETLMARDIRIGTRKRVRHVT